MAASGPHPPVPDQLDVGCGTAGGYQAERPSAREANAHDELHEAFDPKEVARIGGMTCGGQAAGPDGISAPSELHEAFDPGEVRPWDAARFELIRKLQDSNANEGQVLLMRDLHQDRLIAVKRMPNVWVKGSHGEFVTAHPSVEELPWQDIGGTKFLNSVNFPFANTLYGVYRDDDYTYVASAFSNGGDLYGWCQGGLEPGPTRETSVGPLAVSIVCGMMQLHDMQISHRDISLENILTEGGDHTEAIRIIDFGMAATGLSLRRGLRGKPPYQAPEMHTCSEYDVFLSDAFSIGVALYAIVVKDYPWLSTHPGGCKCFQYAAKHGFRAYVDRRKLRGHTTARVGEVMSEPLKQLLEGMLAVDPAQRLTLGGKHGRGGGCSRKSVWDEPWLQTFSGAPSTERSSDQ